MQLIPQKLFSFTWYILKSYKYITLLYIIMSLLAGLWGPFNSVLLKWIIDSSDSNQSMQMLWIISLFVLNYIIFDNATWRVMTYLNYKYLTDVKNKIVSKCYNFILGNNHQFFQENLSGYLARQITVLADNLEKILFSISFNFFRGTALAFMALGTCYSVNPKFFYIMVCWFLVFGTLSTVMYKRLVKLSDIHTHKESIVSGQLVDVITNVSNVRMFARQIFEVGRIEKFLLANKNAYQIKEYSYLVLNIVQGLLIATMLGSMGYFLISLRVKELITTGDFALVLSLSMEVGHTTWFTMSQVSEFYQSKGKCEQSLKSLIVPQTITDAKGTKDLVIDNAEIIFDKVKFHYKGIKPLFENKSIIIKGGEKIGLVGYSGSGKSTFINLISRLYDVTSGSILIDNQNIKSCTQESLRRNISMIPQEPNLFNRSLIENIRYGKIEASEDEVISAAQKAHAHEFIVKLPEGYDSLVGERGVKLSGGQRQRIAIARAILKNAPILILDEATSQLDSVTENLIQESLNILMKNKTTIVVAHRFSTLLKMDRIFVFDCGVIVENGTHIELLAKKGIYTKLWNSQIGGFLVDKKNDDET